MLLGTWEVFLKQKKFFVQAWVGTWFISKMSQMWPKCCTKMSQTWPKKIMHQKEILMIESHMKYMKLFVNMLSIICVLLNKKFHNTSESFYFEVILVQETVSCEVQTWTIVIWTLFLTLILFNFQRPACLDSIINKKFVDSMFAPGAVSIQNVKFSMFLVTNVTLEWAYDYERNLIRVTVSDKKNL